MELLQKTVLQWYTKNGRRLPWRETTDPYRILVSEIMLQQTQVDRVVPKFHTFLEKFPTACALARAPPSDVLKIWSGLGYNRRALYLQRCAQALVEKKIFPETVEELQTFPGIGEYTAAAILSFAFNKDVPVIDVNIKLLYKRIFYGQFEDIHAFAQEILPKGRSRNWHNALMDIGALYCTSMNPKCPLCPLKSFCASAENEKRIEETRMKKNVVPFKKSDRIVRGTILKILTEKNGLSVDTMYTLLHQQGIKRKKELFLVIIRKLEEEGLLKNKQQRLFLPE